MEAFAGVRKKVKEGGEDGASWEGSRVVVVDLALVEIKAQRRSCDMQIHVLEGLRVKIEEVS